MTNGEKFKSVFGFGIDGSKVIAVNSTWWDCEFQNSKPITKRVPAADVRPVVRGRWVEFETDTPPRRNECSECGYITNPWLAHVYNFCPNCGADMRSF